MEHPLTAALAFPGGYDHASVRNGNADTCHDLGKGIIADCIGKSRRIDIIRRTDTGNGNGMRSHPVNSLQMLGVHKDSRKLIAVFIQPEQNAKSYIINAALHGTVHSFGMISIVMLRSPWVKLLIRFLVIGFLEKNVGADAGIVKLPVIFHGGCSDVYVYPADGAVFVFDGINGLDRFQYVFNGIVDGILSCFQGKTLVALILKSDNFRADFLLGQLFAGDVLVDGMVGTVSTAVYSIVGKVQRRKHYNTVAVKIFFDLLGQSIDFLNLFRGFAGKKHGGIPVA